MGAEEYEAERAVVGNLDVVETEASRISVPTGGGASGNDLLAVLERVRADDPEEPFWTGVRRLSAAPNYVELEWFEPVEPRLLPSGPVEVECHLYDEEARQEAERRRAEALA